jgi:hypothetical protein
MSEPGRMPRYDIRNDGMGPYVIFYCESCEREFRSQPDVKNTISTDMGRKIAGDLFRKVPLFGGSLAENVTGQDPRYTVTLSPEALKAHWKQVSVQFRECPTCKKIVCLSDFDERSGFCNEDSPRVNEITEARGEQAGRAVKGFASAFGLGEVFKQAGDAAKQSAERARATMAQCPQDGTLAPAGTKFCPECGSPMVQPTPTVCPKCGTETHGAKFCPGCGNKMEVKSAASVCPSCGSDTGGAKFCPECGAKQG